MPFLSPGDLPDPGIKPRSPALQADALTSEPPGKPNLWEPLYRSESHILATAPPLALWPLDLSELHLPNLQMINLHFPIITPVS